MEIKPVKKITTPKYPIKEEVTKKDLKTSVPKRWVKSTAATIALGALVTSSFAGCRPETYPLAGEPMPPEITTENEVNGSQVVGEVMAQNAWVAPLFEHGEGRGAFGCVMIAPPVFLSEQEALEVINEVAKEYGLTFSSDESPTFYDIAQPITNNAGADVSSLEPDIVDMRVDFAEKDHGIAIEFISTQNVRDWHRETDQPELSVGFYDILGAAQQLHCSLNNTQNENLGFYTVGVMYDPCEYVEVNEEINEEMDAREYYEQASIEAKDDATQQLKEQVIDFFEWLKQQGVI